jgi:hypothetical protein
VNILVHTSLSQLSPLPPNQSKNKSKNLREIKKFTIKLLNNNNPEELKWPFSKIADDQKG